MNVEKEHVDCLAIQPVGRDLLDRKDSPDCIGWLVGILRLAESPPAVSKGNIQKSSKMDGRQ